MRYKYLRITLFILICYNNVFAFSSIDTTYVGSIRKDSLSMFIFGNYNSKADVSVWKTKSRRIKKSFSLANDNSSINIYAKFILFDTINVKGQKQIIIVTQNSPSDYKCQSCSPILALYMFSQISPFKWQLKHRSLFAQEGNWGAASDTKLISGLENNFYIITTPGVTLQGITMLDLHLFTLINNDFKKVLSFEEFEADNAGNCDEKSNNCWSFNSTIKFLQNKESNPDLEIHRKGTEQNSAGSIIKIDKIAKFKFDGSKYIPVTL
jgi:hypothetical protein